ncbi:MAG: hypothetical protein ACFE8J_19330 [Candidatus Heimdallarchaeota archaeon]
MRTTPPKSSTLYLSILLGVIGIILELAGLGIGSVALVLIGLIVLAVGWILIVLGVTLEKF